MNFLKLAEKHGTPLFIFNRKTLVDNYEKFTRAFSIFGNMTTYYSIKTNNNPGICSVFAEQGACAEISSGLSIYVAELANFRLEEAVYDGLYKTSEDLTTAIKKDIGLINIESLEELKLIDKIARRADKKQDIGIRLSLHDKKSFIKRLIDPEWALGYPTSRFGFSPDEALHVCKIIKDLKGVNLTAIMIHPHYLDTKPAINFVAQAREQYNLDIDTLNLGGGFQAGTLKIVSMLTVAIDALKNKLGINTATLYHTQDIEKIAHKLHQDVARNMEELNVDFSSFCFEPGRYLVDDAGVLLLRVVLIKKTTHSSWAVVDGGTNVLFGGLLERRKIDLVNRNPVGKLQKTNIAGPLLYRSDIVALRQELPILEVGDLIVAHDAGAYNLTRSTQFMNPRPPVLLVDGEKETIVKVKEEYDDVLGRRE